MKKIVPLILLVVAAASSCKKTSSTTNNNIDTTVSKPAFLISGVTDVTFTSYTNFYGGMNISVQYQDSAQESVSLSFAGFPPGVGVDTNMLSGIPTYSTTVNIIDTGARPGVYPITITAATPSGKQRNYSFNLNIQPVPSIFFGKYNNCTFHLGSVGTVYSDSIFADPTIANKIWFGNFANTGSSLYALLGFDSFLDPILTIPAQTINGSTYQATSTFMNFAKHQMYLSVSKDGTIWRLIML